jgi:hypothetical protein
VLHTKGKAISIKEDERREPTQCADQKVANANFLINYFQLVRTLTCKAITIKRNIQRVV